MDNDIQSHNKTGCTRLRIRRDAWEQVVRQLQTTTSRMAVGTLRRHGSTEDLLLLVDLLEICSEVPTGKQRPPLADWCVIIMHPGEPASLNLIVEELRPQPGQLLVVIELSASDSQHCRFWSIEKGAIRTVDDLEIIGAGMLHLTGDDTSHELTPLRASRTQGALGTALYERLQRSTVTVVGLGRNGSQLCFMLAGIGVGRLRLLDADLVGLENLDGMPGLTIEDLGCSKVAALARRLHAFSPDLSLTYLEAGMTNQEAAMLLHRSCDLFVTTVDDDTPRLGISLLANRTFTPHLDIGTAIQQMETGERRMTADIRLLLPGMCVACIGGLADAEASLYALAAPDGALQRGPRRDWSEQRAGSLVHWNSIACGLGVEAWLSLLRGDAGAMWHRLETTATGTLETSAASLTSTEDCQYCHDNAD